MIKLETNKMQKAIERARAIRPRVRVINADERIYSVTGSHGNAYTVKFVIANGLKLAECDCAAGRQEMMCFHVAAAAQVNVMVQSMRRPKITHGTSCPSVSWRFHICGSGCWIFTLIQRSGLPHWKWK